MVIGQSGQGQAKDVKDMKRNEIYDVQGSQLDHLVPGVGVLSSFECSLVA